MLGIARPLAADPKSRPEIPAMTPRRFAKRSKNPDQTSPVSVLDIEVQDFGSESGESCEICESCATALGSEPRLLVCYIWHASQLEPRSQHLFASDLCGSWHTGKSSFAR